MRVVAQEQTLGGLPLTKTSGPHPLAVFPLMVLDEMATVPELTATPPPNPVPYNALFPLIEEDVIVTSP